MPGLFDRQLPPHAPRAPRTRAERQKEKEAAEEQASREATATADPPTIAAQSTNPKPLTSFFTSTTIPRTPLTTTTNRPTKNLVNRPRSHSTPQTDRRYRQTPGTFPVISPLSPIDLRQPERPTIVTMAREEQPTVPDPTESTYTSNQYRRDAAALKLAIDRTKSGTYPHLTSRIDVFLEGLVVGVHSLQTGDRRRSAEAIAEEALDQPNSFVRTTASFDRLVTRFKKGPTQGSTVETSTAGNRQERLSVPTAQGSRISEERTSRVDEEIPREFPPPRGRRYDQDRFERREYRSRRSPYRAPPRDPYNSREPTVDHTKRRKYHRRGYRDPDPSSSDSDDDSHHRRGHGRTRPRRETHRTSPSRDRRVIGNHHRRLRPGDVQEYDGISSVNLFINRIVSMVNRYGEDEVLSTLPLCLKGIAREWYDTLTPEILNDMDYSSDEWIIQLRNRFQKDIVEAEEEADRCVFRFAEESKLDLRSYITRKTVLLREAGYEDSERLIVKIWRGLDAKLMNAVQLNPHDSMEVFTQKLYRQEFAARREWQQMNETIRESSRRYQPAIRTPLGTRFNLPNSPRAPGPVQDKEQPRPREYRYDQQKPLATNPPRLLPAPPSSGDKQQQVTKLPDQIRGRPRYACTLCGSWEHLDSGCPTNPRRTWTKFPPNAPRGNKVYVAGEEDMERQIEDKEDEYYHVEPEPEDESGNGE